MRLTETFGCDNMLSVNETPFTSTFFWLRHRSNDAFFNGMNDKTFQDLVKGRYGRKTAYVDYTEVNRDNVLKILGDTIGVFNFNKPAVKYLWSYKNGDQPVLYREKTIRDDIINKVVENHAWEIVRFKNAQTYGEPVQFVSLKKDDAINRSIDRLNDYFKAAGKELKDINSGEWTSAVGTGYKAIQMKDGDIPFRLITPTPMNTYIVYSRITEEPLLAVMELKDSEGHFYYMCYSDTHEYKVQNSTLQPIRIADDGTAVYENLHAWRGIPIVEYPNNQDRISDIELVISMLDAINNMQSNRMDAVEQFVQSWVKFVNCEIDEESFQKMKMMGALVVKSNNGSENKADVDVMTQELSQSESQVAKDDLWDNVLSIEAIPNKEGNTGGGDTQGAVALRNGWDFSKQAAKMKDPYIKHGDKQLAMLVINRIRVANNENLNLTEMDFEVQVSHSPLDNLMTKAEALEMLLRNGIHPLIAIRTAGLWGDSEKVYLMSKEYIDKMIYDTVSNADSQIQKAEQLLTTKENVNADEDRRTE